MPEKHCNNCGEDCTTDNKTPAMIPYIVFDDAQVRNERKDKRNLIIILVLIFALLFSNMAWLWTFNQYDYSSTTATTTYTTDSGDGGNAIINDSGEVNINGESN